MRTAYLFSQITDDDITSSVFISKDNALVHIKKHYSEYKLLAEDKKEDAQYWRGPAGDGLLLEKLRVEDY